MKRYFSKVNLILSPQRVVLIAALCIVPSSIFSQSTMEHQLGTTIEVTAGADICADNVIIDGTYLGTGTKCSGPLPVEMTLFNAAYLNNSVILNWRTETEVNNYGFEVQRSVISSQNSGEEKHAVSVQWEKVGFVSGHGNSNSLKNYSFKDENISSGKYYYRLKQIDNDGSFKYSIEIEVEVNVPLSFALYQNYPNPFNPTTSISYRLSADSYVLLKVYNVLGEEVRTLVNENKKAGVYTFNFDSRGLSNGVYLYRITAGKNSEVKKMIVLK